MTFKEWISEKWGAFLKSRLYQKMKEKTKELAIKLLIIGLIILAVWLLLLWLKPHIFAFLENHPWLNSVYQHVVYQISKKTYLGLFYASLFGAIFFIAVPLEIIIIYYISLGKNIFLIALITLVGGLIGLFMNYVIGRVFGEKAMKFFMKDTYSNMKRWVDKYGGFLLVVGSAIPSPIEAACLVYGTTEYSIKKFFIYNALGRIMKIIALYFLADWLLNIVIPYFNNLF